MSILDDNFFEAMRLILPEHRAAMKMVVREKSRQMKPILSEDQLNDMSYVISESIENRSQIRVTLFNEYGNKIIIGHPLIGNGRLKLQTNEGIKAVLMDKRH